MTGNHQQTFRRQIDLDVEVSATLYTTNGKATGYSVVLLAIVDGGETRTVRVWDDHETGPHFHRYDQNGNKGPRQKLPGASPGEGFRMALAEVLHGYREMIDSWR